MQSNNAMASKDKERRRSINFLSRVTLGNLPSINTNVAHRDEDGEGSGKGKKKASKRNSIFGLGLSASPDLGLARKMSPVKNNEKVTPSPKLSSRPRTLQKGRPTSIFGSLGRRSINEADADHLSGSPVTPPMEEGHSPGTTSSKTVLYHGEVQTTSGMFRKKKEYLVLTDTHLIRYKSQIRAAEIYSSIRVNGIRSSNTRHPSTASIGSLQEVQSIGSHASSENENRIPLRQIVTAYKVEDGRPFFTTEVVHLDEECHGVGSLQLILQDPKEADLWLTSIRGAAEKARLLMLVPFPDRIIRYLASALEEQSDYSTDHFQVFRVVRRVAVTAKGGRSSSDDLQKLSSSVFYMVIGINKVHFIPLPDFNTRGNLVAPKSQRMHHGIVSLLDLKVVNDDDRFELVFRLPLQGLDVLELAASATQDIAISLVLAWRYLHPLWEDYSFNFACPKRLGSICDAVETPIDEEIGCFDRTLVAYCLAYNCNPNNIQYAIDYDVEDAPEFALWPPRYTKSYKLPELLSVMRALRYNETFRSISFRDIDLHSLHGWIDSYGKEHVAGTTRMGVPVEKYFTIDSQRKSLLYQEIQSIALKSSKLRRMDFTNTLPRRRPKDTFDIEGRDLDKDPGSEIVAALLTLCQKKLTNVDWIILNGIELGDTDLDFLIPALNNVDSRIRAIECARCGLNERAIIMMITHLARQNATIECINISGNPGRIQLDQFQTYISRFTKLRRLDLSKTLWTKGSTSMFLAESMLSWQLEELNLNSVLLNDKTLDVLKVYLANQASRYLNILQMDQCDLNGDQVAKLMYAMTGDCSEPRQLEFHVSGNRLDRGISEIVDAIEANHAPTCLFLQMIEFAKEDYFRQLLEALRKNTTIRILDISKASLPYDAGDETCETLRRVFSDNQVLEELDISGEQAHLEVTRFGIGLNHALTGLSENNTLKVLRIEYQNLGLEGANTLASVVEANNGLTHIYCEHNNINLTGFTVIVNALAKNHTVLVLPFIKDDQNETMKRMNADFRDNRRTSKTHHRHDNTMKGSVRRKLHSFGTSKPPKQKEVTAQDMDEVARCINDIWGREASRLAQFLDRNNKIAAGLPGWSIDEENMLSEDVMRPSTALSDQGILEQVLSNTTPRVEMRNPVDDHIFNLSDADAITPRVEVTNPMEEYVINTHTSPAYPTSKKSLKDLQENPRSSDSVNILRSISPSGAPQLDFPSVLDGHVSNEKLFEAGDENGMFMMES